MKRLYVILLMLLAVPVWSQNTVWHSTGIGGGGALYNPVFNPDNPDELYAGCDMSGLFHSTDAGQNWEMLHFSRIQGGNQSGVQFTSDPNVRYAVNYANDGMQLVKSTDAGSTWTALPGDPTGGSCWVMAVDPTHTTNLFAVDYSRLYYSNDGRPSLDSASCARALRHLLRPAANRGIPYHASDHPRMAVRTAKANLRVWSEARPLAAPRMRREVTLHSQNHRARS